MQKNSSHSSRDARPGQKSNFKKDDGRKSFNKDAKPSFKKNYDGRQAAGATGEGGPARKSKPYSGRVTDGDKPNRPFGKSSFSKDSKPGGRVTGERKFSKDFDKTRGAGSDSRPFSDRPKRTFDKPSFRKEDGSNGGDERKPRRDFDKPRSNDNDSRPFSDRPKRNFDKPSFRKEEGTDAGNERKPRRDFDKPTGQGGDSRPFRDRPKPSFDKEGNKNGEERKPRKDFDKPRSAGSDSRPFRDRPKPFSGKPGSGKDGDKKDGKGGKPYKDGDNARKNESKPRSFSDVMDQAFHKSKSPKKEGNSEDIIVRPQQFEDQVFGVLEEPAAESVPKRPFKIKPNADQGKKKHIHDHSGGRKRKYEDEDDDEDQEDKEINQKDGPRLEMPLNKFIAHSGECSRRDAAGLVKQGKVKVNGELVLDPGYRVKSEDKVTMSGKKLTPQKGMVYILLNKPKGFITTNEDPQGRKTVMELVASAGVDRLFPVGRLDRDTSGLLLITNDGDLTQKLCHPSYAIKKVYQVTLDKPLTNADFDKILAGVNLDDGIAEVDALAYLEKKSELGMEIHSGRNRIVRRIFESLGYEVVKLDRVMYAGLTKKNLPRSKWRFLDEREIVLLKHFKS